MPRAYGADDDLHIPPIACTPQTITPAHSLRSMCRSRFRFLHFLAIAHTCKRGAIARCHPGDRRDRAASEAKSVIGQTLGHYRITAAIGAGGMGEVYRATDTQLGREVAIKVLPAALAQDAERLARFEREAKLLASLNRRHRARLRLRECFARGRLDHALPRDGARGG
jgi:hypothetical protein